MSDLSSVTDNYLPTASETFTDNLSSSIAALATTVPVNSAVEYEDGDTAVLTVEPGTANEATFVGKKDVGANQFIECVWTEGNTAVGHDAGSTIIDYDSATHYNLLSEALQLIMNQDGTLKDTPIRTALGLSDASTNGWEVFPYTMSVASGYNNGNKSFDMTVADQDVTSLLTPGMRLRLERSTTAPTQCADFESSSSQYASKSSPTGITFTDDFTIEAWVKLESYTNGGILSRYDGTSGLLMYINSSGQVIMQGNNSGAQWKNTQTYQSLPLGRWVHIASTMDLSGNSFTTYLDGVEVPSLDTLTGTPSAIVQAGNLQVGAFNDGSFFDGKLSDVRVWSDIRTATEIQDNMNQTLTGTETGLVAYYPLNGNFEDSTSNENDLTAAGSATADNADNPFSDTQYGIVTAVSYSAPNSTVTVFTGTDHMIPNMTLTSPSYSTASSPYGFPRDRGKWSVEVLSKDNSSALTSTTWVNGASIRLSVPIGSWAITAVVSTKYSRAGTINGASQLSESSSAITGGYETSGSFFRTITEGGASLYSAIEKEYGALTIVYLLENGVFTSGSLSISQSQTHYIRAVCAYL